MSAPDSNPRDLLSRAEDALRGAPTPAGPSEEVVARTLAALAAAGRPKVPVFRRRLTMIATLKIAAMLLAAAGGAAYLFAPPSAGTMAAFAATVQTLREAQSYSYRMTMTSPDLPKPLTAKTYYRSAGLMRSEQEGGPTVVVDSGQGKTLILDAASKTALLMTGKPLEKDKADGGLGLADRLRKLEAADGEPAGEREIDGVKARGFRIKKRTDEMTFWINPETRLPLRIESTSRIQGKEIRGVVSEFVINPDLDDALFSTEPPTGYALRRAASDAFGGDPAKFLDVEDAAVRLLRLYADKSGGTFPAEIDDLSMFDKLLPAEAKKNALPNPELLNAVQTLVRFMMATRELPNGFGYKADGVKLGDADTIIFWYKPKGADLHRAVYGDLHGADVAADKLPEPPKKP